MNDEQVQHSEWEDCKPGEISTMVGRISTRRRMTFALQLAGGAGFGLLLGVAFVLFPFAQDDPQTEFRYAGISCFEVRKKADDFIAGRLPKRLHKKIDAHVAECDGCRKYLADKKSSGPVRAEPQRTASQSTASTSRSHRRLLSLVSRF